MAKVTTRHRSASGPAARRKRLLRAVRKAATDAMLVTCEQDVRYLTGFTGDSSWLLLAGRGSCLITDGRYGEQSRSECPDVEICVRHEGLAATTASILKGRGLRRIGLQTGTMTLGQKSALAKSISLRRLRELPELVGVLRAVKEESEIRIIRKAVGTAQRALVRLMAEGARGMVGRTEREVAAKLEYLMRLEGADEAAFPTIVAAGAHGSLPHYGPGSTRIRRGQAVLIDYGARVAGYCSDLTRVVFTGRIPSEVAAFYDVVRRAQAAGIAAVGPGVRCCDVDAAARRVIVAGGYGEKFIHSLGHGIGLDVHEGPGLAASSRQRLKSGMVVTVEPGIYVSRVGGVRIEDDVLVTADGRKKLSSLPTDSSAMVLR